MLSKTDTLFSRSLMEKGVITAEKLQPFLDEAAKSKEGLLPLLLKKGGFAEDELLKNLSDFLKVPFAELHQLRTEPGVTDKVPLKIAEYYKMVPLKLDKKKLTVAVSAPPDLRTQDDLRAQLGFELEIVLARQKDVAEAMKHAYGFAAGTLGEMVDKQSVEDVKANAAEAKFDKIESIDTTESMAGDATIAKLVNQIILEAYRKRATDIHMEPYRGKVKLRYRIDGVLYNANVSGEISRFIMPILSRIKIMSNLNIVEKRLPQDGRAIVKVEDSQLDLRVSSIPTPYGESVVIRLLPMNRVFDLKKLGLNATQQQTIETLINKPHGIIFITGPTGSGKSTTLYACLNNINNDERKIITIEDPVEYEMDGVTQIQVSPAIGLDFARGLRSMLRHDPDVMMVGEVRDLETAEMAIRVALTGHLVFSTLHTNDAASGITRLVDIGIPPYLVASSVEAFIAQRLIRTVCQHCKKEDKDYPQEIKERIAKEMKMLPKDVKIYAGKGCSECNFTGFWGRQAIYEMLLLSEPIKELIMRRAPAGDIKKEAVSEGMRSLRHDGWLKVLAGLTSPSEIFEVAPADEDVEAEGGAREAGFKETVAPSEVPDNANGGIPEKLLDRRLFPRLNTNVNVSYRIVKRASDQAVLPGDESPEMSAVSKDIGGGGMACYLKETIASNSILEFKIHLPGEEVPLECLAKVIRYQSVEGTPFYETALCFLDLDNRDRHQLEKYVERAAKR